MSAPRQDFAIHRVSAPHPSFHKVLWLLLLWCAYQSLSIPPSPLCCHLLPSERRSWLVPRARGARGGRGMPVAGRRELLRDAVGDEDGEMSQWMSSIKGNGINTLGLNSTCFQDHPGNKTVLFHLQLCRPMQGWCDRLSFGCGEPPCCFHSSRPLLSTGKPGWKRGSSARRVPSPCSRRPLGTVVAYPSLWAEKLC